jgi:hypothetical protein
VLGSGTQLWRFVVFATSLQVMPYCPTRYSRGEALARIFLRAGTTRNHPSLNLGVNDSDRLSAEVSARRQMRGTPVPNRGEPFGRHFDARGRIPEQIWFDLSRLIG